MQNENLKMKNDKLKFKIDLAIFYKLLHDSLLMLIIFFTLSLIAEAALPGIIISHIGFSKMIIVILINILLLQALAKKITADQVVENIEMKNKSAKKIIILLLALGVLLIFNSQMKMNVFLNLFFILVSGVVGYLSYRILFD